LVAGVGRETVVDLGWESGDFTFATSFEGDATVPLTLAKLENAPVWYTGVAHGDQAADDVVSRKVSWEPGRRRIRPPPEKKHPRSPRGRAASPETRS
jgi:hypothetical protein